MLRRTPCLLLLVCACDVGGPSRQTPSAPLSSPVSAPTQRTGSAAACQPGADWHSTVSGPPQRIYGNTWFVGTCGITALLVTSATGHILFDGATAEAAPVIEANIRSLGFRVEDVRLLVTSHAHLDHVGGFAKLKADSGAVVVSRGADAAAIERGHGERDDPQYLIIDRFPSVSSVRRVQDGETLRIGELAVTAHATPGHTPGSTSWTWDSCEVAACRHVAYVDSVRAIADDVYRYGDEAAHPGVVAAFESTLSTIEALPCDILLTPHPDASDLWLRLGPQATAPLVDHAACRAYAANGRQGLHERLAKERAAAR